MTIYRNETETTRIAILDTDFQPMPDGDGYVPQFTASREYGVVAYGTSLNIDRYSADWITGALNRLGDLESFTRWARIFHGVNATVSDHTGYSQGDNFSVITWPSKEWRDIVGVTDNYTATDNDVNDLVCWVNGDVYYATLELATVYTAPNGKTITKWDSNGDATFIYTDSPEEIEVDDLWF